MTAPTIAITGGVGAGKSSLCQHLLALGARHLDADAVSHAVLEYPDVAAAVIARFGPTVQAGRRQVNRQALGRMAFSNRESLRRLTEILYPRIRVALAERIAALRATGPASIVLEAPTLFESGCDDLADVVVTVEAPLEQRERRCRDSRNWPAGEVERRERFLVGAAERKARADHTVVNEGTADDLRRAAAALWQQCSASTYTDRQPT